MRALTCGLLLLLALAGWTAEDRACCPGDGGGKHDRHDRSCAELRFDPAPGCYACPVAVAIGARLAAGERLVYTIDGSAPGAGAWRVCGPVLLTDPTRLRAAVVDAAGTVVRTRTGDYAITSPWTTARPVACPPGGAYPAPQTVVLRCPTPGASIRYTLDGSEPGCGSPRYCAPLVLTGDTILRARAFGGTVAIRICGRTIRLPALFPSGVMTAVYRLTGGQPQVATPVIDPPAGLYRSGFPSRASTTTPEAVLRYRLDGADPGEADAVLPATGLGIDGSLTLSVRGFRAGWTPSAVARAAYVLQPVAPTASPPAGRYAGPQSVVLATATDGTVIRYTLDGSLPTAASPVAQAPIPLAASATLTAIAVRPGWTDSEPLVAAYQIELAPVITAGPVADPAPVFGRTTALSVSASDPQGLPLSYQWSADAGSVVFQPADAPASTATFAAPGSYPLRVTVRNLAGQSVSGVITVTVQPTPTTLVVTPAQASVPIGGNQVFAASMFDQFGQPVSPVPAVAWTVAGGGSIDAAGQFSAGLVPGGPYAVGASGAGLQGSASVTVVNAAPVVVQAATADPNPVSGSSAALSVLGADDGGEASLTYTWTTLSGPAPVTFTVNGSHAAQHSEAAFTQAGTYDVQVTITDRGGLSAVSQVRVLVQPTPTTLVVTPAQASVPIGGNQVFAASMLDQFGQPVSPVPAVAWTVAGGGSIDAAGQFSAGLVPGGPYAVGASGAGLHGSASVTVVNAAPVVVQAATADPNPVSGSSAALSVLGADDGGEASLTYTWTTLSGPAPVTFTVNGSHVVAAFTQAGTYDVQATITDRGGLSVVSQVRVLVQPTLTALALVPAQAAVLAGQTLAFVVVGTDQFGQPMVPIGTWSCSGAGGIDQQGLFTADQAGGQATVRFQAGSLQAQAVVQVAVPARQEGLPDTYAVVQGGRLEIAAADGVLANDTARDGGGLSVAVAIAPQAGSLTLAPDGSFVYQHAGGPPGQDAFTYRLYGAGGITGPVTVGITVQPPDWRPAVEPILEGVEEHPDGTWTAWFGYRSAEAATVWLPIGPDNHFSQGADDRGQVVALQPGRHGAWATASFAVPFDGEPLSWILGDQQVEASRSSPRIPPFPAAAEPLPPVAILRTPAPDAVLRVGQPLLVQCEAYDPDGTVSSVQIQIDGAVVATRTPVAGLVTVEVPALAAGGHAIRAVAIDAEGLSASAEAHITITTGPLLTVRRLGDGPLLPSSIVRLGLYVEHPQAGDAVIEAWYGGVALVPTGTTPPEVHVTCPAEGTMEVTARAVVAGQATSAVWRGTVDLPPEVMFLSPTDGGQVAASGGVVPVLLAASDPDDEVASVALAVGGVPLATRKAPPWSFAWTPAPGLAQATLTATATDRHGATASATAVVNLLPPPTVAITAPGAGAVLAPGQGLAVRAEATSQAGIQALVLLLDGQRIAEQRSDRLAETLSIPTPGMHTLAVEAFDRVGGSATSAPVQVRINAPPVLTVLKPLPAELHQAGSPLVVEATATDPDGAVTLMTLDLDGVRVVGTSGGTLAASPPAPDRAMAQLRLTAADADGGLATLELAVPLNRQPVVAITAPAVDAVLPLGSAVPVLATASDPDGEAVTLALEVDGVQVSTAALAWTPSRAGPARLTVVARDGRGGVARSERTVLVVGAPVPAIELPLAGQVIQEGVPVTLRARLDEAALTGLSFAVDGEVVASGPGPVLEHTLSGLAPGPHRLVATAELGGGLSGQAVLDLVVNAAPQLTLLSPLSPFELLPGRELRLSARALDAEGPVALLTWRDLDAGTVLYQGPALVDGSPAAVVLPPPAVGPHRYRVEAVDADGAGAATAFTVQVLEPSGPPRIAIWRPRPGEIVQLGSPVVLHALAADDRGVPRGLDRVAWSVASGGTSTALADGRAPAYDAVWIPATAGPATISATAIDVEDQRTDAVPVEVIVNTPPSVALAAEPAADPAADPVCRATVADADGDAIAVVELRDADDRLLAVADAAPWLLPWPADGRSSASVQAIARDVRGGIGRSTRLLLTRRPLPSLAMTGPAPGAELPAGRQVQVRLDATGDGPLRVFLALDGSELPALSGPPWQASLDLAPGWHTFAARVIDGHGAEAAVAPRRVRLVAPPQVAITAPAADGPAPAGQDLAVAAAVGPGDLDASLALDLDGIPLAEGTGPLLAATVPDLAAGRRVLRATATDAAGRATTAERIVEARAPPRLRLISPVSGVVPAGVPVDISLAVTTDAPLTALTLRDAGLPLADLAPAARSWRWAAPAPGLHLLQAEGVDAHGNVGRSAVLTLAVGTPAAQPPTVAILAPAADQPLVAGAPVTVEAQVTPGAAAISEVRFLADGVPLAARTAPPWTAAWTPTPGTYQLAVVATDAAGAMAQAVAEVRADAALAIALTSPADAAVAAAGSRPLVALAVAGPAVQVEVLVDGTAVAALAAPPWSARLPALPAGTYVLGARARSAAGAAAEAATRTLTIAETPSITLDLPADGRLAAGQPRPVLVEALGAGPLRVEPALDGEPLPALATLPGVLTLPALEPGPHRLVLTVIGAAGLRSTLVRELSADRAPTARLAAPAAGGVAVAGTPLAVVAAVAAGDHPLATVRLLVDGTVVATLPQAPWSTTWTPPADAPAAVGLAVEAVDTAGLVGRSPELRLAVNRPPLLAITAPTPGASLPAGPTTIAVDAADPDGEALTVTVQVDGAVLGTLSGPGTLAWQPTVGMHRLRAWAVDARGAETVTDLGCTVGVGNAPPTVALRQPSPGERAAAGSPLRLVAEAADNDGVVHRVTFHADGVAVGVSGSPPFAVIWTPASAGTAVLTAVAEDDGGAVATSAPVLIEVADDPGAALAIRIVDPIDGTRVQPGTAIPVAVEISGALDPVLVELEADGVVVATAAAEPFATVWTGAPTGAHVLVARVFDRVYVAGGDGLPDPRSGPSARSAPVAITVGVADQRPLTVALLTPADGSTLTSRQGVRGTVLAGGAPLVGWTLTLRDHDGSAHALAAGSTGVGAPGVGDGGGELVQLDPGLLPDGAWVLELRATDSAGRTALARRPVVIQQPAKPGTLAFTETDLEFTVGGVPVRLERSYDSLERSRNGELGYGWRYELGDGLRITLPELRETVLDIAFAEKDSRAGGSRDVVITLPDGQVARFAYTLELGASWRWRPRFTAPPGVAATLVTEPSEVFNDSPFGFSSYWDGDGVLAYDDTHDFQGFALTLADGTVYHIVRRHLGRILPAPLMDYDAYGACRVSWVQHPDGSRTIFGADGIDVRDPLGVLRPALRLQRDGSGRVVQVYGPELLTDPQTPPAVRYVFDAAGDLVAVDKLQERPAGAEPIYQTTSYRYEAPGLPHLLTSILGPDNRERLKAEYDASGRLIATVEGAQQRTVVLTTPGSLTQREVDALGGITTTVFDAAGNVVAETDPLGHTIQRVYDAGNRLLAETDALGRTTRHTYDANGFLASTTDPAGFTTTYANDPAGRPLLVTDALGRTQRFTYDARGNVLTATDAAGQVTTWTYDAAGKPATRRDPLGRVTTWTHSNGRVATEVDAAGILSAFGYDGRGNLASLTRTRTLLDGSTETLLVQLTFDGQDRLVAVAVPSVGVASAMRYGASGEVEELTDPLGRITRRFYDARDLLEREDHPDTSITRQEHDALGRLFAEVDALGRRTEHHYDAASRKTSTTNPDGSYEAWTYDAAGQALTWRDRAGLTWTMQYDALGREIARSAPDGSVTRQEFDAVGRQVAEIDGAGRRTELGYDARDNLVSRTLPDGRVWTYGFDAAGRRLWSRSPTGQMRRFGYDALDRLTTVIDESGGTTRYAYDDLGYQTSITDANGHTTLLAHDVLGRRVARTWPGGGTTRWQWNADGTLDRETAADGRVIQHGYDLMGRRTSTTTPGEPALGWTWHLDGQRATMTDGTGETRYDYDATSGLLTAITRPWGAVGYSYDGAGRVASLHLPGGRGSRYGYDAQGRLTSVTPTSGGLGVVRALDGSGRPQWQRAGNGLLTRFRHDDAGRLVGLTQELAGATIAAEQLDWDADDRRAAWSDLQGRSHGWTYDGQGRLRDETIRDPAAGLFGTIEHRWDGTVGLLSRRVVAIDGLDANPLRALVPDLTQTFDAGDQTAGLAHDARGRVTAWQGGTLRHDHRDRLVGWSDGTRNVSWQYDADGVLVGAVIDGQTRRYLTDPLSPTGWVQIVGEMDGSGAVAASFDFGPDGLIAQHAGADLWPEPSHDGGVRVMRGIDGTAGIAATSTAFGITLTRAGPAGTYGWKGERHLSGLPADLVHLRARTYDPAAGRFLSRDPFEGWQEEPLSAHDFGFGHGDAPNASDPGGMARGGVYILRNRSGKVMRTGRSRNLVNREYSHKRAFPNLKFEVVYRTDRYATQRGLEKVLYDKFNAPLDFIRPISPTNGNIKIYIRAATDYLNVLKGL